MTWAKKVFPFILLAVFVISGCSRQSHRNKQDTDPWTRQCAQWAHALAAPKVPTTIADVSSMLGEAPKKCETLKSKPMLGAQVDNILNVVKVGPGSPAEAVGMQPGEKILQIGKKKIKKRRALVKAVQSHKEGDPALVVRTDKGTYSVVPKKPKDVKECSWKVRSDAGGDGKKTFEATCRFFDELEAQCTSSYKKK